MEEEEEEGLWHPLSPTLGYSSSESVTQGSKWPSEATIALV